MIRYSLLLSDVSTVDRKVLYGSMYSDRMVSGHAEAE